MEREAPLKGCSAGWAVCCGGGSLVFPLVCSRASCPWLLLLSLCTSEILEQLLGVAFALPHSLVVSWAFTNVPEMPRRHFCVFVDLACLHQPPEENNPSNMSQLAEAIGCFFCLGVGILHICKTHVIPLKQTWAWLFCKTCSKI